MFGDDHDDGLMETMRALENRDLAGLRAGRLERDAKGQPLAHLLRVVMDAFVRTLYARKVHDDWPEVLGALMDAYPVVNPSTFFLSRESLAQTCWRYGSTNTLRRALSLGVATRQPDNFTSWSMMLWVFVQGYTTGNRIPDAAAKMALLRETGTPETLAREAAQLLGHYLARDAWPAPSAAQQAEVVKLVPFLRAEDFPDDLAGWLTFAPPALQEALLAHPALPASTLTATLAQPLRDDIRARVEASWLHRQTDSNETAPPRARRL